MDQFYDFQEAGNALEQLSREGSTVNEDSLANLLQGPDWTQQVDIVAMQGPKTWRMIRKPEADDMGNVQAIEEKIFTVRGIICDKDLPPVLENATHAPERYKYLRQSVSITGLGSPTFEETVRAAQEIQACYERSFSEKRLQGWTASYFRQYQTLYLTNRYFTPKRDAPGMEDVSFDEAVDPYGILEGMKHAGYVHGEENDVKYFVRHVDLKGTERFDAMGPQVFRVGDIVEVQVSFVVVPLKGQTAKMQLVLHSIALLNSQFSKDANTKRNAQKGKSTRGTVQILKRKVGYGNEIAVRNVSRKAEAIATANDGRNARAQGDEMEGMEP